MRFPFFFSILAIATALVVAYPATSSISYTEEQALLKADQNPCQVLSSRADVYLLNNRYANRLRFKPSEVYACLRHMPINRGRAIAHIDWLLVFLQFQSTVPYLKDPPKTYHLPAVDLVGSLQSISKAVATGGYISEYDFQLDIYNLINKAKDGHLEYNSESIARSKSSYRDSHDVSLVSLSLDGLQVPKIYFHSDFAAFSRSNFIPSAISSINSQAISQYMEDYTLQFAVGFQDLDALYNSVFHSPATTSPIIYPGSFLHLSPTTWGDNTTCIFENGTSILLEHETWLPLTRNGLHWEYESESVLNPSEIKKSLLPSISRGVNPLSKATGKSIVRHTSGMMRGYFLDGPESSDVAVLNIHSFLAHTPQGTQEFQDLIYKFLNRCRSFGKGRLIIDVRANGGGNPLLAIDLFKQLFPTIVPYTGYRFRGSEAINALGVIASGDMTRDNDPSIACLSWSIYNARHNLRWPDGPSYDSWGELYPPLQQHGDVFSMVSAWKLSNSTLDLIRDQIVVSGYADRSSIPPQVFAGKNIILLTDGQCSSVCSFFANLLLNQGHVVSATVGGRPNNQPIAVVGGVQGGLVFNYHHLTEYARQGLKALSQSSASFPQLRKALEPLVQDPPIDTHLKLNTLDMIAQGDESSTPLQFAAPITADCRFYYNPSDLVSVTHTWERVARGIKANGAGLCVNGTLGGSSRVVGSMARPSSVFRRAIRGFD